MAETCLWHRRQTRGNSTRIPLNPLLTKHGSQWTIEKVFCGCTKNVFRVYQNSWRIDIALTEVSPLLIVTEFRAAGPIWSPVCVRALISVTWVLSPIPWSGVRHFDPWQTHGDHRQQCQKPFFKHQCWLEMNWRWKKWFALALFLWKYRKPHWLCSSCCCFWAALALQ